MIDYIDEMCRVWGRQKRRIMGEPAMLQDPVTLCSVETQSLLVRGTAPSGSARGISGRVVDEGPVGAAIHSAMQRSPPEVLLGDGLKVSVAIQLSMQSGRLTERQYQALFICYVVRGKLNNRLHRIGVGRKCFYDRIHRAHLAIQPWLDSDTVTGDEWLTA